jgi:hypothetical protein
MQNPTNCKENNNAYKLLRQTLWNFVNHDQLYLYGQNQFYER